MLPTDKTTHSTESNNDSYKDLTLRSVMLGQSLGDQTETRVYFRTCNLPKTSHRLPWKQRYDLG